MKPLYLFAGVTLLVAAGPLHAQDDDYGINRARDMAIRVVRAVSGDDAQRAALGIDTRSTGKRDTLGLLIQSVRSGSPAEKAGLEEGNRIAAVNGVNLKLAPADAGEPDMRGLMTRRLVRELKKVKAGDEVKLDIYADGKFKAVSVKTESLAQLDSAGGSFNFTSREQRAAAGLGLGGGGSIRDTLGILVVQVVNDGPADKAGIGEGDRIQSINGTDLRVPASEAKEGDLLGAKEERFSSAIAKLKPGDTASLKVYSDGAVKDVKITLAPYADVYKDSGMRNFQFNFNGDGSAMRAPLPPRPPRAPRTPMAFVAPMGQARGFQWSSDELPAMTARLQALSSADLARTNAERALVLSRSAMASDRRAMERANERRIVRSEAMRDRGMMGFRDLRVAPMNADLASYFGKGAAQGLLVLDANRPWDALKPGDVILSVNGTPVRKGDSTSLSLNTNEQTKFEVIRKGKRQTITVPAQ